MDAPGPDHDLAAAVYALIPERGAVFSRSVLARLRERRGETNADGLFGRIVFGRAPTSITRTAYERALVRLRLEDLIRYGIGYFDPKRPIEENPLIVSARKPAGMIGPWLYRTVRRAPGAPKAYEARASGDPTRSPVVAMLTGFHEP